jgi:uncharacterized OsmC-like protein
MNAEQLKEIQAPIKEKYKTDPASAMVTLKAEGEVGNGISCRVETGKAMVEAGLHPASGGNGMLACSGDMLLEALVACAGVTLRAVATAIGVDVDNAKIRAEGDLDFRGTLGVSRDVEVGFRSIRLFFDLNSEISEEKLVSLSKLTERYCVVYQTLLGGISIETNYSSK